MARDAFTWPLHENDPINRPLGDGATYATITEPKWTPLTWNVWYPAIWGVALRAASDPTRKIYYYDGAVWTQLATAQIPDSLSWLQSAWSGTPENPTSVDDNPFNVVNDDKLTFDAMRRGFRYSTYLGYGGTAISGAVDKDIVIVRKATNTPFWKVGVPLQDYCWQSITATLPNFGASRMAKIGGLLRVGQSSASYGIKHALVIAVTATNVLAANHPGTGNKYVWPANGGPNNPGGTGNVYMGSLLALLPPASGGPDLTGSIPTALGLETLPGLELARAAQDYGIYIVEGTGGTAVRVFSEYGIVEADLGGQGSATFTAWKSDLQRILNACRLVSNNHNNGAAPATAPIPGGSTGTLRATLAESFGAPPIPAAPTNHVLINPTTSSLTAQANAAAVLNETGFELEYRLLPTGFTGTPQITDIPEDVAGGTIERVVTGLSAGDYESRMRSKGAGSDRSAWSNVASGTVPAAVTGRTELVANGSGVDGTDFTTANFATDTSKPILVAIQARTVDGSVPNTPTLTKGALSFTLVNSVAQNTFRKLFLFRAVGTTTSGSLGISFGAQAQTSCVWVVEEFTGLDTADPVVQSVTGNLNAVSSLTITLAAFADSDNPTYGAFGAYTASLSPGGGFVMGTQVSSDQNVMRTEFRPENDTTVDVTISPDSNIMGIGVELRAASPVSGSPPIAASNPTITVVDYRTLDLACTDNSTDEDGFKWRISKNNGSFVQVATTGVGVVTYRYVDPTPGVGGNGYRMEVAPYNTQGDAPYVRTLEEVETPAPPLLLEGVVYPTSAVFPDAGSKVFPRTQDVKFPS